MSALQTRVADFIDAVLDDTISELIELKLTRAKIKGAASLSTEDVINAVQSALASPAGQARLRHLCTDVDAIEAAHG
jgi:hypothetical protein